MSELKIPKRVFIVPYRNRIQHKFFFSKYMSFILEDCDDYEIYFSHQCDARTFNRGAVKNIGFTAVKNKYPNHYKNITFIFNDIDTIPFHKVFDYETSVGVVKHYYGYKYALGGIVVIKGADFEKINGYPCYWGWGMEDNSLQNRCKRFGINIDRSTFYEIGSPQMLQLFDGISRIISKKDPWRSQHDSGTDGLITITKLNYSIDASSDNPNDNIYSVEDSRFFYINIKTFLTETPFESQDYFNYDLREPQRQIIAPNRLMQNTKRVATTDDWSNIPYYPTVKEKRVLTAKHLVQSGKNVPITLLNQIDKDKQDELITDVYNKNVIETTRLLVQPQNTQMQPQNTQMQTQRPQMQPKHQTPLQNAQMQHIYRNQAPQRMPSIYSPELAQFIGYKYKTRLGTK